MEAVDIVVRLVGAFYAVGGIFAIRAMAMSELLDRALDMITLKKEEPKRVVRRWLLGTGAALTGASGVAAALLSVWAVPLFVANALLQLGWLAWARTAFPPEDAEDARGRRSTTNAALGYIVVTALVLTLWRMDRLVPAGDPLTAGLTAAATLFCFTYLVRSLRWRKDRRGLSHGVDDDDFEESWEREEREKRERYPDYRHPARLRFEAVVGDFPMMDAEDGRRLDHFLYVEIEIAEWIETWRNVYATRVAAAHADGGSIFRSAEAEEEHRAEGERLVHYLRGTYGHDNVDGPVYVEIPGLALRT